MIEVNNLSKKYGSNYAVKDLSFTIEEGFVYGLLGPNGAGKSTTMNAITGYIAPTCGSILINGIDIQKKPREAKKHIGYLPEIPPLYPDMTVREYLDFTAELKGVDKKIRKEQLEKIMEKVMISDVSKRLIRNLSKGYRQRVGLASAIIGYPDIIILDEPTVGLDPKQITEIRELIKSLAKEHTVILSSHILSEVQAVCDKILIISQGKLVAMDTPEGLENQMSGSTCVNITVKADKEGLSEILSGMPEIKEYSFSDCGPEGLVKCTIIASENAEVRDVLSLRLAKEGIPIYELCATKKSLEDVFLELTEEKAAEPVEKKETEPAEEKEAESVVEKAVEPAVEKETETAEKEKTETADKKETELTEGKENEGDI